MQSDYERRWLVYHVSFLFQWSRLFIYFAVDFCVQVYTLGTILSMQISFVGFQPVQSSEHMAVSAHGCFYLVHAIKPA